MNKEEILELSKNENRGSDLPDKEAQQKGTYIGFFIGAFACLIVSLLRGIIAHQNAFEVWFIFFAIEATIFFTKYYHLKKKHELITALIYTLLSIGEFVAFMLQICGVING